MSPGSPASHRRRVRLATATCAAAIALAGCSASGSGAGGSAGAGFVTGDGGVDTAPAGHRQAAPALSGDTVDGRQAALADYKGKVVVLNVWGSWCTPCRAEAKGLEQVYAKYKDQGVQFLGINTRDTSVDQAKRFEQNFGVTYPSLYDPDGAQILKFPKGSLNPQLIPTTVIVDREGKLAARAMRAMPAEDLEAMLKPVLAERP